MLNINVCLSLMTGKVSDISHILTALLKKCDDVYNEKWIFCVINKCISYISPIHLLATERALKF